MKKVTRPKGMQEQLDDWRGMEPNPSRYEEKLWASFLAGTGLVILIIAILLYRACLLVRWC